MTFVVTMPQAEKIDQEQTRRVAEKVGGMLAAGRKQTFDEIFFQRVMSFCEAGESLKELGARVGLPPAIYGYDLKTLGLAQNARKPIRAESVMLCAIALGVSADWLLTGLEPADNLKRKIEDIEEREKQERIEINRLFGLKDDFDPFTGKLNPHFRRKVKKLFAVENEPSEEESGADPQGDNVVEGERS